MSNYEESQDPKHRRPLRSEEDLRPGSYSKKDTQGADTDADELDEDDFLYEDDLDDVEDAASLEGASPFDTTLRDDMHILSFDEADDLEDYVDEVAAARERLTVEQLLQRLRTEAETLDLRDLFVLSDLTLSESARVEQELPLVAVEHRRRLIQELTRASSDFIELQLGRLLRVALRDADATVRRLAVDGLWEETEADLIGPLTAMLASDPDIAVRAAAASALGAFVLAGELDEMDSSLTMRVEQALLAVLQTPGEPVRIQARALESLAFSSEEGLRQLIEDAYYAPEEEMRLSALRAMGRSADTRWRAMVRAELSSPDAAMRAEAARACGELEVKAATREIIDLLDDRSAEVRLAAIDALGHLGGQAARDALRQVTAEGDDAEAAAAELALEEMLFYTETDTVSLYVDDDDDETFDDSDSDDDATMRRPPARKGG